MSECKKCGTPTFGPLCSYCKGERSPFEREPVRVTTYMQDIHSKSVYTVSKTDYDKLKGENDQLWRDVERVRALARTLADEVDARDTIIDKLLAMLEPGEKPEYLDARIIAWKTKRELHARAREIAGRKS